MNYLMEHPEEYQRLEKKTRANQVIRQASWAGIKPGMHVLDAGCGVGKTTAILKEVVGETGRVTGLDISASRLSEARKSYGAPGVNFVEHDLSTAHVAAETYDAVWIRFLLEYFLDDPLTIVRNAIHSLKPGGILILADLDNNSMGHYGHTERLEKTIRDILHCLQKNRNFDPYAGRKLYAHMVDLGFDAIDVEVEAHHLFHGELSTVDAENWLSKIDVAVKHSGCLYEEYDGSFEAALEEFKTYFFDPRRFIYTPLIITRGTKPLI